MTSVTPPSFRNAQLTPAFSASDSALAKAAYTASVTSQPHSATLQAQVLNTVIMQQQANQTAIQYKAQVIIDQSQYQLVTQFPLAEGDQIELQKNMQGQLHITKVIASANNAALDPTQNASSKHATYQAPVDAQQIQQAIRMWLSQSPPTLGSLIDLTLSMEAASKLLEAQSPLLNAASATEHALAKLLSQISGSIQKELFNHLPNADHQAFKHQIQHFITQMLQWPLQPSNVTESSHQTTALNEHSKLASASPMQNTLVSSLLKIQSTIEQSLEKITADVTANQTATRPLSTHIPILKEWMQVLTLMAPSSHSHQDMQTWLLESIRRMSGNSSHLLTAETPVNNTSLAHAKQASETLASAIKEGGIAQLISTSTPNAHHNATTAPQANQPLNAQQNAAIQTVIDSSQWLRLAEFRKHQLFSGSVKHALLQNTQELQLTNIMRQLLISVEELTGRMTSLRLASAAASTEVGQNQLIHLDIPVMTQSGPTNVEMDLEYQPKASSTDQEQVEQWQVYLKFELPPIAPFIGEIVFQQAPSKMTACFYSSHKETLALLKQESIELSDRLSQDISSDVSIQTRFGLIEMPRNRLTKQSLNKINIEA